MRRARFYVDADLLALGKALVSARYDVTYPGDPGDPRRERPPCVVTDPSVPDPEWIPTVASEGLVVISRDLRIGRSPAELKAVRQEGLRIVFIDSRRDPTTWGELAVLVHQWRSISGLQEKDGPLLTLATKTTFREIDAPNRG